MDITTKLGYLASGASSDLGTLGICGRHASGAASDTGLPQIQGLISELGLLISGAYCFWSCFRSGLGLFQIWDCLSSCPYSWDFTNAALFASGATSYLGTQGIWGITLLGLPQIPGCFRSRAFSELDFLFLGFLFLELLISGSFYFWGFL